MTFGLRPSAEQTDHSAIRTIVPCPPCRLVPRAFALDWRRRGRRPPAPIRAGRSAFRSRPTPFDASVMKQERKMSISVLWEQESCVAIVAAMPNGRAACPSSVSLAPDACPSVRHPCVPYSLRPDGDAERPGAIDGCCSVAESPCGSGDRQTNARPTGARWGSRRCGGGAVRRTGKADCAAAGVSEWNRARRSAVPPLRPPTHAGTQRRFALRPRSADVVRYLLAAKPLPCLLDAIAAPCIEAKRPPSDAYSMRLHP